MKIPRPERTGSPCRLSRIMNRKERFLKTINGKRSTSEKGNHGATERREHCQA
ncbi:hypothetical protein GMO_04360 [Gluconobacter morbifer G707]|uniref:Uncharacterized protein n=1 Tax=Gluconobacter morbifer G707 TaxID=1088869 RepID=G6XG21_9PROT|nr:hypothetical protein GMO_04360 [Gluconobacter morbifer G707]